MARKPCYFERRPDRRNLPRICNTSLRKGTAMTNSKPLSDTSISHSATTIVTLTDKDVGGQIARQPQGRGDAHMMLDFRHVRRFGAAGLTAVLALGRRMRTGRGRLSLVNLGVHVQGVFAAVGLDTLFAPHRREADLTPRHQSTTRT